jgi:flagellar M-ring protein FliF
VHADVDFSEVQATRESYPQQLGGIRQENGGWTREGGPEGPNGLSGGNGGGIPGSISNAPPPAATTSPAAPGTTPPGTPPAIGTPSTPPAAPPRTTENYTRTFELGREVSVTRQPVGSVRRISVAVALKQPEKGRRTAAEISALQDLVKGAVGFDQARGDQIAVNSRAFAAPEAPVAPNWYDAPWVSLLARNLTALLIAAVVVFGVARPLIKRLTAGAAARDVTSGAQRAEVGKQIASVLVSEARSDPARPVTLDMIEAAPGYAARAELIRNFVRQDPARAALVVRDLIRADTPAEARNG